MAGSETITPGARVRVVDCPFQEGLYTGQLGTVDSVEPDANGLPAVWVILDSERGQGLSSLGFLAHQLTKETPNDKDS